MTTQGSLARRSMGAPALWFLGVSASAPMTVLVGGVVQTYAPTSVIGVPLGFVVLGGALMLLSVGYTAVTRHVGSAAPFYSSLAHGLGPWAGLAGGLVAVLGYSAIEVALYGLLGATLAGLFGGAWWIWAALGLLLVATLGLLRVGIGAGLITVLLVLEIAVIVMFIVGAFTHPAGGSISGAPMAPGHLLVNGIGGASALLIACFSGYESGASFVEEARTNRAVAGATFTALTFLGPFDALAAWALAVAVGPDQVVAASKRDPELPLTIIATSTGPFGPILGGMAAFLLVTSILAAMLSLHSTVARYVFAWGRERILPAVFGRTGTTNRTGRDAPIKLRAEFAHHGVPREVMLLAEHPHYQVIIDIFRIADLLPYTSLSTIRPSEHWRQINTALDAWGWP